MARRGVDYLFYHQVDNPAVVVCDPAFLGFHARRQADVSLKVLRKSHPTEKLGLVVSVDQGIRVIEYSDLPREIAYETDSSSELRFWAGSPAIHVFSRTFFERLIRDRCELPFHCACKPVTYLDEHGTLIEPDKANALKFERFIFDTLPHAENVLVVEADRRREFHPIKNRRISDDTPDTPAQAQQALLAIWHDWLTAAGATCAEDAVVEISPLFALDADEVRHKIGPGARFCGHRYLR
jgi:UDP-N-acetylglucosamine/UDP-N-acetylgalactosamine diphosphorylase